jgi:pyruvate/2-oxoglutarate dehydrogenase complex dihydrolipoamide dehydrogenase (E3) component
LTGERVFQNVGTHATIPDIPGVRDAKPMTNVETLELDRIPIHLIVIGGGYVGLEMAQAIRRFGSQVTVIENGPQLAGREDSDAGEALSDLFKDEGISVLLKAHTSKVSGTSGGSVHVHVEQNGREWIVDGTDLAVAVGRTPNTQGIGLEKAGIELDGRGYIRVNERLETAVAGVSAMGECA